MRLRPLIASAAVSVLVVGAATAGAAAAPVPAKKSSPGFASAATATVFPGVQTTTDGAQCTANFVYVDGSGTVYLGQSAHCAGTGGSLNSDGCLAGSLPLGTRVTIQGASSPGELAYSSWLAMQAVGEKDEYACRYNDFALIRLHPNDIPRTNPSVPVFGGPVGVDTDGTSAGEQVVSYGNSSLRLGLSALRPKRGVSLGDFVEGWTHTVYTATPGIPGDSGSGVLDAQGRAIGTLSTLMLTPYAGSNGVSDLSRQLAYARSHGVPGLELVAGTEAFRGVL